MTKQKIEDLLHFYDGNGETTYDHDTAREFTVEALEKLLDFLPDDEEDDDDNE